MSDVEEKASFPSESIEQKDDNAPTEEDSAEGDSSEDNAPQESRANLAKQEEEKLKAKFPKGGRPMSGHSVFLQKRLANRQKYFDSGDYQMAKQKSAAKARQAPVGLTTNVTGDTIPTPETVPVRKASIIQPCKFMPSANT